MGQRIEVLQSPEVQISSAFDVGDRNLIGLELTKHEFEIRYQTLLTHHVRGCSQLISLVMNHHRDFPKSQRQQRLAIGTVAFRKYRTGKDASLEASRRRVIEQVFLEREPQFLVKPRMLRRTVCK